MSSTLLPPLRDASTPPGSSAQRTAAMILAGVGVAGLAVGTYYGMRFVSERDEANSVCPSSHDCTPEDLSNYDSAYANAKDARTLAYVGFGIGGAALVTGAVLFFTAPSRQNTAWRFSPALEPRRLGATFTSRF